MSSYTVHTAALNKQLNMLRSLVSQDPSLVNALDADSRTPLHWAASSGSTDIVNFLLDNGADVTKKDGSGWTVLHIAASAGNDDVVKELLGAGADVKAVNDKGLTPLHYAASKAQIEIGKMLLARGADINVKDRANQTPLHRAATTGSTGFVSLLLHPPPGSGAAGTKTRLNTGDRVGNTPLHLAMESGHAEVAVLLIEAGADRDRTNQDDETPEAVEGVGGLEQKRAREYVKERCGPPPS